MAQNIKKFSEMEKIRNYFCKLIFLYTVITKYPKPDESNQHTQLHFFWLMTN
jgi:hypothetical protein